MREIHISCYISFILKRKFVIHSYQADVFIIGCVQVRRHQLCGGQLLGLEQRVETVYNTNVQFASHWAQLHLDFCFPGNGAETKLTALEKEPMQ